MKKLLIITYYWPPSGGSGVQRWLKFTKYLPEFGWEPIVYTPENPNFDIKDQSLLKDISPNTVVLKRKIWEPYHIYQFFAGKKNNKPSKEGNKPKSKKSELLHKIAFTLRGNLLIPDPRCFWIKPSVKYLTKYLKENPVDAIVSTGPPHSMHEIALKLHRKTDIPWIADFRDPWTNIDFYKDLNLTCLADKIHHKKEQKVISEANCIVSVTPTLCAEFEEKDPQKVALIYNGYDEADIVKKEVILDSDFSLVHIGIISYSNYRKNKNKDLNHNVLWEALHLLVKENEEFRKALKVKLIGKVDTAILSDIERYELSPFVEVIGYLPHVEVIEFQQKAQVLLLLINNTPKAKGILTGKLFEYMASQRPILAIAPTGSDITKLLHETKAGSSIDFQDVEGMKNTLLHLFEQYQSGTLSSSATGYKQYSRRAQCEIMAQLLNEINK